MKAWIWSLIAAVFVCLTSGAFEAGRRAEIARENLRLTETPAPAANQPIGTTAIPQPSPDIESIALLPFPDFYRQMRAASPQQRADWERQLQAMRDGPQKYAALTFFYRTLIQVDPEQALRLAKALSDDRRYPAARLMAEVAPPRALGPIAELLLTVPSYEYSSCSSNYLREVMDEWSAADPVPAAGFVDANRENAGDCGALVAKNWAMADPEDSRLWLERHLPAEDDEKKSARSQWLEGYFEYDHTAALEFAVNNQADASFEGGLRSIAGALYRTEPDDVDQLVNQLHGASRSAALEGVARATETEITFVDGGVTTSQTESHSTDYRGLMDWFLKFPLDESGSAISSLMMYWKSADEPGLLGWIAGLSGDVQTEVASRFPVNYSAPSVEDINALANVPDQQLGMRLLERMMKQVSYQQEEALASLQQSQLSAAQKKHLANLIPPPEKNETP